MKKFFKTIFICLIMLVVGICSTACFGGTDGDFLKEISGIKVCYKPSYYDFESIYKDYSSNLLKEIVKTYGNYNSTSPLYTDSIRYQISDNGDGTYSQTSTTSWKWHPYGNYETLTLDVNGKAVSDISTYLSVNAQNIEDYYNNYFVKIYSPLLSIVTSQIVLGYTPTVFEDVTALVDGNDLKQEYKTRLENLLDEVNNKSSYVGMTNQDKEELVTYILNNVIGENIINSYSNTENAYTSKKYNEKITAIVDILPEDWTEESYKSSYFNPFASSYIEDYKATSFFLDATKQDGFESIPAREYQSLLLMPSREFQLIEIWLGFEAEADIDIRVGVRYFDGQTLKETPYGTVSVKKGAFDWNNGVMMLPCEKPLTLTEFNNGFDNNLLNTQNTSDGYKKISPLKESGHEYSTEDFYKLRDSENGFGGTAVLDEATFDSAGLGKFYEVYFDVVKTPGVNQNTSFKVGFVGIFPKP